MSAFVVTHTCDVLRGEDTDEYGDPKDADTVVIADLQISIVEGRKDQPYSSAGDLQRLPVEGRETTVRKYSGRARPGSGIRRLDRLRATPVRGTPVASIYLVEALFEPPSPIGAADIRMELRRIDQ